MIIRQRITSRRRGWKSWLLGTIAALYTSRLVVEFAPARWPTTVTWLLGLGLAGLALAAVLVGHRRGWNLTPLAVLALYVISPGIDPRLAVATAFVALAAILLALMHRLPSRTLDIATFLVALAAYTATLAPGLLPADSGEFQLVAPTLGIAHPPGYALYTLAGKLFTLIPLRTPAWRLNLLSAMLAAATLVLVSRTTRQLTHSAVAGLVAALALAGATTFWAQATTANIRMPTAFFAALLLWLLVRYGKTRAPRELIACAFAFGLGIVHHGSLGFVALPAALYLLGTDPRLVTRGRLILRAGLTFGATLLVLLYFPIRGAAGNAPLDPGGLTTLNGFLNHVLARGFRGDVLYFTGRDVLPDRLAVLANILNIQFGWPLLVLATIALIPPLRQYPIPNTQYPIPNGRSILHIAHWIVDIRHSLLLAATFILVATIAITYRAPQTVEYLMPAYVALAILIGVGVWRLAAMAPSPSLRAVFLAVALLLGAINIRHVAPSFVRSSVGGLAALGQRAEARAVVEPVLRDAPPGATILANWHWATAFWYLQTVEGQRRDVHVQYVAPAGAEPYPGTWRRRLAEAVGRGPVIVTNRYATYADLPLRLIPFHQAFLATAGEATVPAGAIPMGTDFGKSLRLLAYALPQTWVLPGDALTIRLWWQPLAEGGIDRDYSVFVHLVDAAGTPVGQQDVTYPAAMLGQGCTEHFDKAQDRPCQSRGVIEEAYLLPVLPAASPGDYTLVAGVYFRTPEGGFQRLTTPNGGDLVPLATVRISPRCDPPVTRHPLHVPFAGGPILVGADYDTSRPESTRVYLHWRTPGSGGPWMAVLVADGRPVARTGAAAPAGSPSTTLRRRSGQGPGHCFLTTALDVPPGTRRLKLQVIGDAGERLAVQGAWRLPLRGRSIALPRVQEGDRYLVFGGEMALVDARVERRGNEVAVDLAWLSLRPLWRDYTVSVQLQSESWHAQHDGTPALGAVPTLKWIRGTQVLDRHRIELPEGAAGPADVQITVYDAFTQTPLGVLDDRFQRAGQGQGAVIGRK